MDGLQCKDPASVTVDDFFYSGLHLPSNTTNQTGAGYTTVSVNQVPGLNTLGLFLGRIDLQPDGYVPPHFHPRGTEVVTVLEGSMEMGFVTSYPDYRHIKKVLEKGDFFVVPVGLLHYVRNVGSENAAALWAINSQNPGTTTVTGGVFAAKPPIDSGYLAKAFLLDKKTVEELQTKF